ncbi:MAG: hypothetical protein JNM47_07790 [Hyphomonadaceae bacterium]|nr:hypothetical protein [Hyphomonadaceae bacterium]
MDNRPSVIERAFQLAKSGKCESIAAIREQLSKEDYPNPDAVRGTALVGRLKTMITAARMPTQA